MSCSYMHTAQRSHSLNARIVKRNLPTKVPVGWLTSKIIVAFFPSFIKHDKIAHVEWCMWRCCWVIVTVDSLFPRAETDLTSCLTVCLTEILNNQKSNQKLRIVKNYFPCECCHAISRHTQLFGVLMQSVIQTRCVLHLFVWLSN